MDFVPKVPIHDPESQFSYNADSMLGASIPPENVGANTGNTAFVIGERAADLFMRELGIEKRRDSPVQAD